MGNQRALQLFQHGFFNFLAHTCTFAGNKRFNMPRKSHIMHQPKVAVFDIFNLAFSGSSEAISSAFQSTKPGRRKRNRKVALPGNAQSGTHATTDTPLMQRSARIAVLVESLSDHYTNKIISGIEAAADKTGYEIAILNILGKQLSLVGLDSFEGFIACCSDGASVDPRFFEELGKPVIVVGNVENVNGYHCVKTDYQKGAQLAVNHLIDQGCENIMMISSAVGNTATELDQYLGYRDALKKSGKSWQEPVRVSEATIEAGISIAAQMFENNDLPDGVFISNDWVAAGFVKYLKKKESGLNTKTVVVGFGNDSLCEMIEPALCSIDFRKEWAGSAALHVLFEQIGGRHLPAGNGLTIIEPALAARSGENNK